MTAHSTWPRHHRGPSLDAIVASSVKQGGCSPASESSSPASRKPRRPSISLFRLSCPNFDADAKLAKSHSHGRSRSVSGRLIEDGITLLPFLDRPQEVRNLIFETPANAKLASRLERWAASRGQAGHDFLNTLTTVDRSQMDDDRWATTLRHALVKDVPDLWASLALALGADALTPLSTDGSVQDSGDDGRSIDDGSTSDLSTPSSSSFNLGTAKLAPLTALAPIPALRPSAVGQSHRHQPMIDDERAAPASPTEGNQERWRSLRFHRPIISTAAQDDSEALTPQRSQYSFARTFEGPTMMNARSSGRPKAYSMTHYLSSRELNRLDAGKEADITPYEEAAKLEAEGCEKPPSLGVLKDGRTRHPSAGTPQDASAVAAMRASLGLSPTCPSPSGLKPCSAAGSSKAGSDIEDDSEQKGDGEQAPTTSSANRSALAEHPLSRDCDDRPDGDMGIDFGDEQCEEDLRKFVEPEKHQHTPTARGAASSTSPSMRSPLSPPWSPSQKHQQLASSSPQSPHLIFPLSPRASHSRGQALSSLLDTAGADLDDVRILLGPTAWTRMRELLTGLTRSEASDARLLERLAMECFGLVDLDETDERKRKEAEDRLCEDPSGYKERWAAFEKLLTVLKVPRASIAEAERRCAPGEALYA